MVAWIVKLIIGAARLRLTLIEASQLESFPAVIDCLWKRLKGDEAISPKVLSKFIPFKPE